MHIKLNDLNNPLAISCVEDYYLAQLKHMYCDISRIFYNAYIPISDTLEGFVLNRYTYLHFPDLERVYKTAFKIGYLSLTRYQGSIKECMKQWVESKRMGCILLVEVNYRELPVSGKIMPDRQDHYVALVDIDEDHVELLDNRPLRQLTLEKKRFEKAFAGTWMAFSTEKSGNAKQIDFLKSMISIIQKDRVKACISEDILKLDNIMFVRDAIAVLRITRKRLKFFLECEKRILDQDRKRVCSILEEEIKQMDFIFAYFEYCRRKKYWDQKKAKELLSNLLTIDKSWRERLLTMVEKRQAEDQKRQIIKDIIQKVCGITRKVRINDDMSLLELGIESLEFVELIVEIETELGISFPDEMLDYSIYDTIGDLCNKVINLLVI